MQSANALLDDNSSTRRELDKAIDELSRAARSVRVFADTLERDPSAIIRGKR
jgi:paraquat-inducible protein B